MLRLVTNWPSRPANGESLTWKVMLTVGWSMVSAGSASGVAGSHSVEEIFRFSMPVMLTMSPASPSAISAFSRPVWPSTALMRALRRVPSASITATCMPGRATPRFTRPMPITPT
jgi:hypothetical protein